MRIRKNGYVESDETHCCIGKFNIILSLCKVLEVALYFSKSFSKIAVERSVVTEALWSASWDRSPTCSLLLCSRDTDYF